MKQYSQDESILFEIAWTFTNIACGEIQHCRSLSDKEVGVLPYLFYLLRTNKSEKVKEQLLWAITNISTDYVNDAYMLELNIVDTIMWLLGLHCYSTNDVLLSPALCTMSHVACLIVNLMRGSVAHTIPAVTDAFIHISSVLIQGKDMDCVGDVCTAVSLICEYSNSDDNINKIFELGIASRIRELCDLNKANDTLTKEKAFKVMSCLLCNSRCMIHRLVLLSDTFRSLLSVMVTYASVTQQVSVKVDVMRCVYSVSLFNIKYLIQACSYGIIDAIKMSIECNDSHDTMCASGRLLSLILRSINDGSQIDMFLSMAVCVDRVLSIEHDVDVLLDMLSTVSMILTLIYRQRANSPTVIADMQPRLQLLSNHTVHEVCELACVCDSIIDQIMHE